MFIVVISFNLDIEIKSEPADCRNAESDRTFDLNSLKEIKYKILFLLKQTKKTVILLNRPRVFGYLIC